MADDLETYDARLRETAIQHGLSSPPRNLSDMTTEARDLGQMMAGVDAKQTYANQETFNMGMRFHDHYVMAQAMVHYPDSELAKHYTAKYPDFAQQVNTAIEQHRSKQIGYEQGFGF